MKLKYVAALLSLLVLGCADSGTSTPTPEAAATSAEATGGASMSVAGEGLTKVSLDVTNMR